MSTQPIGIAAVRPLWTMTPIHARPTNRRAASRHWRSFVGRCLLGLPAMVWMAADLLIVIVGTLLGQHMLVWWLPQANPLGDYRLWIISAALGCSVAPAGLMFGLYERHTLWSRGRIVARCLLTILFAMLATFVVVQVLMYSEISRRAAAFSIVFYLFAAIGMRLLAHGAVRHVQRGLLLVGHGLSTSMLLRSVQHGRLPGYRLHGIVSLDASRVGRDIRGVPILGEIDDLPDLIADRDIHEVVVADGPGDDAGYQHTALTSLRLGCRVTNETTFFETAFGEVPVAHITPDWFLSADLRGQREEHATIKRVFDVLVAAAGLLLTLPLCAVIALLVRLQDGGPVLYSQARVGLGGRSFRLYKFRTMGTDAETQGAVWASDDDPRVTTIGRALRRLRLDELPQLWNVLRGDMSMIGPRPERPDLVQPLSGLIPYYHLRHLVKPGLSGWAQINYRYGASVADARRKLQYDLYYIKHMSLELDLIILLRTVGTLALGAR